MLHKPAAIGGKDPAASYKMRLGVWMFGLYLLFYAGFVVINLTSPQLMEMTILLGLNMATVYGLALIIVALLQALLYDWFCRKEENRLAGETNEARENK